MVSTSSSSPVSPFSSHAFASASAIPYELALSTPYVKSSYNSKLFPAHNTYALLTHFGHSHTSTNSRFGANNTAHKGLASVLIASVSTSISSAVSGSAIVTRYGPNLDGFVGFPVVALSPVSDPNELNVSLSC